MKKNHELKLEYRKFGMRMRLRNNLQEEREEKNIYLKSRLRVEDEERKSH